MMTAVELLVMQREVERLEEATRGTWEKVGRAKVALKAAEDHHEEARWLAEEARRELREAEDEIEASIDEQV